MILCSKGRLKITKNLLKKAGFVVSKAGLFCTIFQRVFISIKIRCADKGCATDDITQEYGNHVEEKLPPSNVCACQNAGWDNEHIGDKVLEAV